MKRLLVVIALLLIPAVAYAGWNIRQKDDGSTVWTNQDSKDVPVGDSGLTVLLEDMSSASSAYITSHKAGTLKKIYVTAFGSLTIAPAVLSFHISDTSTGVSTGPTPISTGATITFPTTANAGHVVSVSPVLNVQDGSTVTVGQGDVIIVYTNGASTTDVDGVVTFVIE